MNGEFNNNGMENDYTNVYYSEEKPYNQNQGGKGLAITTLVLGILSLPLLCCCGLGVVAGIIAIILGIIVLATKKNGTGMAIAGIVLSAISVLIVAFGWAVSKEYVEDYVHFATEYDAVVEQYEKNGELPDYLEKYRDEKFDFVWEGSGYDDFDEFFEAVIQEIEITRENYGSSSSKSSGR